MTSLEESWVKGGREGNGLGRGGGQGLSGPRRSLPAACQDATTY